YRLTSDRLQAEDVGPLDVKGFGERIWTWRVRAVLDGAPRRSGVAAPLVGREAELELLQNTYERAVRNRRAHLFTIYGDPGVGKSRLAREFVEGLEGATVLVGRSLPYGESVTYWPLAEMVTSAAGITDDDPLEIAVEKLRESCENEAIAELLGAPAGAGAGSGRRRASSSRAAARKARSWSTRSRRTVRSIRRLGARCSTRLRAIRSSSRRRSACSSTVKAARCPNSPNASPTRCRP